MRVLEVEKLVEIPEGVDVKIDGRVVTISGEKGILTKDFSHAPLSIQREDQLVRIRTEWPRKKEAATVGTISSHIKNMIIGVTKGFTYKLKIVFSHFPISVKVEGSKVIIENFTGERSPRKATIVGDVKVSPQSEDVIVQGINLENVSQTAANIEQATKVKIKDPRVFLDGVYVYERLEGVET
ncbi:MAG: 50S ribosomal protein L6 [Candidatus Bathyarchaeota archaeon]|nr:MAG: 50S ribosomal protein L6 [Candidatus Bathyarchaeota archaeon]